MTTYNDLLVVGQEGVVNLLDEQGSPVPYGYVDEKTTYETIYGSPLSLADYSANLIGGVGRSDLLLSIPHDSCLQIQIVGPVGSGRKSLGLAIAARFGYMGKLINAAEEPSKWLGEWEKNIIAKVKAATAQGKMPVVYGLTYSPTSTDSTHRQVMVNALNGVANVYPIVVVSERPLKELSAFINVMVCAGDFDAIREWLEFYHGSVSGLNLDYIAMRLESQTVYPSAIASATGTTDLDLLNSVRANTLTDLSLAPVPGELLSTDFVNHINALAPQIRPTVRDAIIDNINDLTVMSPGVFFYGPPGTGKTYFASVTLNQDAGFGLPRYRTGIGAIREAIEMWTKYGSDSPMYIILLDECEAVFDNYREFLLQCMGNETSPRNFYIVATTNKSIEDMGKPRHSGDEDKSLIMCAMWRSDRLLALHKGFATCEEFAAVLPSVPFVPHVSYQNLLKLRDWYVLYGATGDFYQRFFDLVELPYSPPYATPATFAAAITASNVPLDCPRTVLSTVLLELNKIVSGVTCNRVLFVNHDVAAYFHLIADHVLMGIGELKKSIAYDAMASPPRVIVSITRAEYAHLDKLCLSKFMRPNVHVIVCEFLDNNEFPDPDAENISVEITDPADGVGIVSTVNNPDSSITFFYSNGTTHTTPPLAGADGVSLTSVVNNGDGTFTLVLSNGTMFTTDNFTGPMGPQGTPGVGITNIANNGDGTFTLTLSDGSTHTTDNFTGPPGPPGTGIDFINDNGNGTMTVFLTDGSNTVVNLPIGPQGIPGVDGNGIIDVSVFASSPGVNYQLRFLFSDGTDYITGNLLGPAGQPAPTIVNVVNDSPTIGRIILSDGSSYTFTIPAGSDGIDGADGVGIDNVVNNGDGTFTLVLSDGSSYISDNFTGPPGADGVGIQSIVSSGSGTTMTITLTNGASIVVTLPVGPEGPMGPAGNGISGVTNNGDGTYTFTFTSGPDFTTGDLTGPAGADGTDGVGISSIVQNPNSSITITYTDGSTFTSAPLQGADGADGVGIANIVDNGDGTLTFVYSNGLTFTTSDLRGADGVSVTGIVQNPDSSITITLSNGASFTSLPLAGADGVGIASVTDNGDGTYTFNFTDGTTYTTSDLTGDQGPIGPAGPAGTDGSDIVICSAYVVGAGGGIDNNCSVTFAGGVDEYTLTFATPRAFIDYAVVGTVLQGNSGGSTYALTVLTGSRTVNGFTYVIHQVTGNTPNDEAYDHNIVVLDMGTAMG